MDLKKESGKGHSLLIASLLVLVLAVSASAQTVRDLPPGVTLDILSVRVLSVEESRKRAPDVIGTDLAVRLRLSNNGAAGIYYFTWPNWITPLGYRVKQTNNDLVWLWGKTGTARTSPGLMERGFGRPTAWILLLPHSAVEWEELDSTLRHGEKHAFTLFVKKDDNDRPQEIVSDFFTVPTAQP